MELMRSGMASGLADQCHTWGCAMSVCHQVTGAGSAPMRVLNLCVYDIPALVAPLGVLHPDTDGTQASMAPMGV